MSIGDNMSKSANGGPSDRTPDSGTDKKREWTRERADAPPRNIHTLSLNKSANEYKRFTIERDGNRPLQFNGIRCAVAEMSNIAMRQTRIALYETKAGSFITEFKSVDAMRQVLDHTLTEAISEMDQDPDSPRRKKGRPDIHKAAVFDSREDALGWFRPGRLTNKLLEQLGLLEPEFIE